MKSVTINAKTRTETGKKNARSVRREGMVPCNLYGGVENISFVADAKEFKQIVYTPDVYTIDLNIDGNTHKAVLQDIQFHPINDSILHADFLLLNADKPVKIELPVLLEGSAAGVKAGGRLIRKMRKLKVKGFPSRLPEKISVNVENVEVGGTVKVREIAMEGIEFLNSPNAVVAMVKGKRGADAAAAEPAAAEKKK